ncbi:hypothetical protein [Leptospira licerasiae]|uniref:Uncharacterized protein n=1 Tax=Leptospira licerasiae str. MMD4847 TaxID=1049971 RepID=A0ABN0HBW4_9LEPT|nr:hypothetical protein [Leptospira licerasiae]EIE02542.1 hypothetical protein LEP1GSC185_0959 [Leptospira licerasiae serovar Varillal str. VAR 010]EJZ43080.1 hypothetical protein LEP1GSC178_3585 [Leptospira licerasiae str. MMD4847]
MNTVDRIRFLRQAIYTKLCEDVIRDISKELDPDGKLRYRKLSDKAIIRAAMAETYIEQHGERADYEEWQNKELIEAMIRDERELEI